MKKITINCFVIDNNCKYSFLIKIYDCNYNLIYKNYTDSCDKIKLESGIYRIFVTSKYNISPSCYLKTIELDKNEEYNFIFYTNNMKKIIITDANYPSLIIERENIILCSKRII